MFPVAYESATLDIFNGECPSEATDKIGMRHIYWSCCQNATTTQGLAAPPRLPAPYGRSKSMKVGGGKTMQSLLGIERELLKASRLLSALTRV
jgi:hypothetical protein